uniref:BSD domain-containing protein n=1 Tax=Nelumbo nucifera TaxID=4432 RepID=A0A822ZFR2_NELNU|nr:TPA_asm: hypothetical protein HUJ06_003234 [Nelumbo nucifera]
MSWLSISLPNPFKSQESDEEDAVNKEEKVAGEEEESSSHVGGVKEDLSELGKTIGRQLWGVASFLAPPPVTDSSSDAAESSDSSSQTFLGIRNDFAEISGSFRSGLSLLSTNKAVNEISKLASNLLQLKEDEEGGDGDESSGEDHGGGDGDGIVGVTDEVLEFAQEMSMRPEFWVDFPLSISNDFNMSDIQREHASTVEHFTPSLAALRTRLCPSHMNEGHFWMIYFIMLYPRINEDDRRLLSTAQIVETRERLLQELQARKNTQLENPKNDDSHVEVSNEGCTIQEENNEVQEKESLAETANAALQVDTDEQENVEQWLEEDDGTGTSVDAPKQLGNEEDVSFSDLEDDDDDNDVPRRQPSSSSIQVVGASSPKSSSEWIQLNDNSGTQGSRKNAVRLTSHEKDSEGENI